MQKKYFARANTSSGCVNLMTNNLNGISCIYAVEGRSKAAKSKLMEVVAKHFSEKMCVECIMSPFDVGMYEGIIIRDIKFAMADKDIIADCKVGKTVYTDKCLKSQNTDYKEDTEKLLGSAGIAYEGLYRAYGEAKSIHDEWENIYNRNMDFERLENYSKGVITEIVGERCKGKGTYKYERFFGASTPDGAVNYISNLTGDLNKRYFIKGRPGTGKSTFLKRLVRATEEAGFGMEVYYCSFDKNSLDMVIIPELSVCVFDSTAPHEMFPEGKRDVVLDFYEESGLSGVDEKCEAQLELVSKRYGLKISEGLAHLRLGNAFMKEREFYLERETDFEKIFKTADKIIRML